MNTVQIDGSKKSWPARLNGVTVEFPSIPSKATPEEALQFLREHAKSDEAVTGFLISAVESRQASDLRGWLNAKSVEEGKSYTREERKALPQRSAKVAKADVEAYGTTVWEIAPARKGSGVAARLKVAEEKARRSEALVSAQTAALLDTLRKLPKKEAEKALEGMVASGILPAGTTL